MEHFETKWKSHDGLDVYAQGWNPATLPPAAVVCLVHGIGEHTLRYLNIAEAFTKEGYGLFGADLRGHGNSGGIRGHFPSAEAVIRDIDLLIGQAKRLYPGIPLILYGHSLGGILVLYYGLREKPDVTGIIAASPGLRTALEEQPLKVMAARILGTLVPKLTIPTGLDINAISRDREVVRLYTEDKLVHDKMSLGFGKIMLGVIKWTLEHAGEFDIPLLLLHGKADTIAYSSGSVEFADGIGDICKLVLWDDACHELHNEPEKAEVLKTMTDWIKDRLNKRSMQKSL